MEIPFLSFNGMHGPIRGLILDAVTNVFDSNWFILGSHLSEFERNYSKFSNVNFCAGVGNGLEAIVLALKALGIGKGDEVIVPSNTYIATWLAVSYVGATPVPVEPNIATYNLDHNLIEAAITAKTKALIPVHLYGQACEMTEIMRLADRYKLFVVEDNAQAQGARFNDRMTGSFGNVNATSFFPGKNLGALGDGGAVTTNSKELFRQVCLLRNYGSEKKYFNEIKGLNSRLDEIQAAVLNVKLEFLTGWNIERVRIANKYTERLKDIENITLPTIAKGATSVFHLYVIRSLERQALIEHLANNQVRTLIHYPIPPHLQKAYHDLNFKRGDFPLAEAISDTCLSLPIYPGLTDEQMDYICDAVARFKK